MYRLKKNLIRAIISVAFLVQCIPSFAYRPRWYDIFCFEEIIPWKEWIPVGCEVVDCCPGCPGPPIDWRIRYEAEPGIKMILTFENLSSRVKENLKITGEAKWTGDNQLEITGGEIMITGFQSDNKSVIVASPRFVVDKSLLQKKQAMTNDAMAKGEAQSDELSKVNFSIDQLSGKYIVNDRSYFIVFKRCGGLPPPQLTDRIRLVNNTGNDNAVILTDERKAACVNDEQWRTATTVSVGNFLSNQSCNAETFVFSDENAMAMVSPSVQWTDPVGDLQSITLAPLIQVPVTVWVLVPNDLVRVQNDINRANQLYNQQHLGIVLVATINDVSANADAANVMSTNFGCLANERTALTGSAFFTAGRLNVYYVNGSAAGNRGINCIADRNISVIGTNGDNESFAHELGHAFSLGHTNTIAGIPATNLMTTGGTGRNSITEGQAFRVNLNPGSQLNANGTRTGATRACADGAASATCIAITLDVLPN